MSLVYVVMVVVIFVCVLVISGLKVDGSDPEKAREIITWFSDDAYLVMKSLKRWGP